MLELIVAAVTGLVAGAVVALKYIAPKTATTKDDKALAYLEKAEALIVKATALVGLKPPAK